MLPSTLTRETCLQWSAGNAVTKVVKELSAEYREQVTTECSALKGKALSIPIPRLREHHKTGEECKSQGQGGMWERLSFAWAVTTAECGKGCPLDSP